MKIATTILIFNVMSAVYPQNDLNRIDQSNFFTDQKEVFYVFSNKFNSSGILGELSKGIDVLQITGHDENRFGTNVKVVSKELFFETYQLQKQYDIPLTIAIKIPNVRFSGFEVIHKDYGRYLNRIFYRFEILQNSGVKSFEVLPNETSKDENHVFYRTAILESADPKSFRYIKGKFAKDKRHVFRDGKVVNEADPASFHIVSDMYQKDQNHVWKQGELTDIDAHTFEVLEYSHPDAPNNKYRSLYAKDKGHIYFQGDIIAQADLKSFRLIISGAPYQIYGIDTYNVFYSGQKIDSADVETFAIMKLKTPEMTYDAQDKNFFYDRNVKIKKAKTNNEEE